MKRYSVACLMVLALAAPAIGQQGAERYEGDDDSYLESYRMGPSGGEGGRFFVYESDRMSHSKIDSILISAGRYIDRIETVYVSIEPGRRPMRSQRHGGGGGNPVPLELREGEYIISIQGSYGLYVDSLSITTNLRELWQHGQRGSAPFSYEAPPGYEIIGFLGRSSKYVDALGVVIRPLVEG